MHQPNVKSYDISDAIERLPSLTSLYRDVFAVPPWNEAYRCITCHASFGKDVNSDHTCCGNPVVDYYPHQEISKRILHELSRTNARIAFATDDDASYEKITGFAWGWEDSLKDEHANHFGFSHKQAVMIREILGLSCEDTFFYLSELGLHEAHRGKGLGKKLYETVLETRDQISSANILMTTSKKSPAFLIATRNPLFPLKIMHEFRGRLDGVVLYS